jgi:hypothetical protein
MTQSRWIVSLLLWAALAPRAARADEVLRCGQRLVSVGVTKAEVVDKCGEPRSRDDYTETGPRGRSRAVSLWTYVLGQKDFVRTLVFENGYLRRVEVGDYPN